MLLEDNDCWCQVGILPSLTTMWMSSMTVLWRDLVAKVTNTNWWARCVQYAILTLIGLGGMIPPPPPSCFLSAAAKRLKQLNWNLQTFTFAVWACLEIIFKFMSQLTLPWQWFKVRGLRNDIFQKRYSFRQFWLEKWNQQISTSRPTKFCNVSSTNYWDTAF